MTKGNQEKDCSKNQSAHGEAGLQGYKHSKSKVRGAWMRRGCRADS